MYDSALFLRTAGAGSVTANELALAGVTISRTPADGLACVVHVPKQSSGDTLAVKLQHSTDNVSYSDLITFDVVASTAAALASSSKYVRRFATELKYVRAQLNVLGTTPDFGAVVIAIGDRDQWNTLTLGVTTNPVGDTV